MAISLATHQTAHRKQQTFPRAHYWLLIPFLIAMAGFFFSYWSVFTQVPFRFHVHGLTATAWYLLLVIQPWVYHQKSVRLHRKIGFVGIFLAGGVAFSALQMIPFNIIGGLSEANRYGFSFFDFGALLGFSVSVVAAMLNSRNISLHARWMISTAFWALIPALGRLVYIPMVISMGENAPFSFLETLYLCAAAASVPLLIMMYIDYRLERRIYLPYLLVLISVPLLTYLAGVMGTTSWWIEWCNQTLARGLLN